MVDIWSKLQISRRSDRFSKEGSRFGAIKFDPGDVLELKKRRAALSEQRYQANINEALGEGFIRREVEALVEGRPPIHPTFIHPERE